MENGVTLWRIESCKLYQVSYKMKSTKVKNNLFWGKIFVNICKN